MPIRRNLALRSLSRDHHNSLVLARGLRSNASTNLRDVLPRDADALAEHVLRVFADIDRHLRSEETVLIPLVRGRDAALDAMCTVIETEHTELRAVIGELAGSKHQPEAIREILHRFGTLLEAHVHHEERTFYARIQEVLDPPALEELGARL